MARRMLFHRQFLCYSGGHGKVFDYFNHVAAHPAWSPRVHFSAGAEHPQNPWAEGEGVREPVWQPQAASALLLGGIDWLQYPQDLRADLPVINLVQHVRHGDPASDVYPFLSRRAIRVCVSQPVADAILASGRVNGPVEVIEAGLRLPEVQKPPERSGVFIDGLKQPDLARELGERLRGLGYRVDCTLERVPRQNYLERLAACERAVLLPNPTEGFYLPALEAIALGVAAVVPDCVGNRAYLQPGDNAMVAPLEVHALVAAVMRLDDPALRERLRSRGSATVARFSMERERRAVHDLLDRLDGLWASHWPTLP